ncbi:hypothetical protein BJP36_30240 [Moorena producens JHB]|uniref:Uncharacterized protein n=1 Tax=Moorena producens (strain JHB) TaxID=1454205 RepID=A0A1D9G7M0_MOOP1|nr:hypothetical protein [Moorena producens]AOY83563.1 hypothetical protein BJP36_30240 [Moorena producens JHB]
MYICPPYKSDRTTRAIALITFNLIIFNLITFKQLTKKKIGVGWANNNSFTICTVIIDMQPTLQKRSH